MSLAIKNLVNMHVIFDWFSLNKAIFLIKLVSSSSSSPLSGLVHPILGIQNIRADGD